MLPMDPCSVENTALAIDCILSVPETHAASCVLTTALCNVGATEDRALTSP